MSPTIAILAALDTKGAEAVYLRGLIEARGLAVLLIDIGVFGAPEIAHDISSESVAQAGGEQIAELRAAGDKARAMAAMTRGAAVIAAQLHAAGRIQGMLGIGGTAGTVIASSAMRALPLGVPKLLVSTVAAGDTRAYVGTKDIAMLFSVVDIAGINRISARVLSNAAGAICGMVTAEPPARMDRPLLAASMFGNTTACVDRARATLEAQGYEVLVFHATGAGGQTMESLIGDGYIDGVLDVTTTELADELCGGVMSAGPARLEAAARAGIPQIVAPGCLDMVNFWAPETVPGRYHDRNLYYWNPNVTLMRTTPDESATLGRMLAEKVGAGSGPAAVLLPLGGLSQLDSEGGAFWWPEADQALFDAIRRHIRPGIPVVELPHNINDPAFADIAAHMLLELVGERGTPPAQA
jgi:uncharacterized protein (UPF0261 family)